MKVLLLGHKGWIGQKVITILDNQNIDYITTDYRGETDDLKQFILNNNITHIYCCLGRTHGSLNDKVYTTIDYLENKETLLRKYVLFFLCTCMYQRLQLFLKTYVLQH